MWKAVPDRCLKLDSIDRFSGISNYLGRLRVLEVLVVDGSIHATSGVHNHLVMYELHLIYTGTG